MLLQNARIRGREGLWHILIIDGIINRIEREIEAEGVQRLDLEEGLVLPPFVESHCHLDSSLTGGTPQWNLSGTLIEGIKIWEQRKQTLSVDDVKKRALKTLKWQMAQGVQYVRTHVDICDPNLTALRALLELKEEVSPWMTVQLVAFPQDGIMGKDSAADLLEEGLRMGADVVGGIPHMEWTREDGVESVKKIFQLAAKYNRLIDVHCDETDDDQSRSVEVIAAEAYRYGIGQSVAASHTTAMSSYNNSYANKLIGLLQKANIHLIANPLVNLHLQGRYDSHPKRRGITRVKELREAGINVSFGHDNIVDPFYPLGTGNMLQVLQMGIHASHLTGYDQIEQALDFITINGARTLNMLDEYGIDVGKPANMIVLPAQDDYDAIRRQVPVRYSIRRGKVVAETKPLETTLHFERSEKADYSL
jgi:cytosine/creatinine deaminase